MADFDVKTGYSAAFRTFVEFAQKTHADGYDSANAKATLDGRQEDSAGREGVGHGEHDTQERTPEDR